MAFELPKSRIGLRQIQTQQRSVPLEQIIAARGQNPLGTAVEDIGKLVGQNLSQRAAARQQGEQLAVAGKLLGQDISPDIANSGIDAGTLSSLVKTRAETDKEAAATQTAMADKKALAAEKRVALELQLEKLKSGYSEVNPSTGATTQYPGVQGLSIAYDAAGNPAIARDPNYKPASIPKSTGGGGGGGAGGAFKNETNLRKEFDKESADSKKAFNSSAKALTLADRGDAIGDTALAFSLTRGALGGQGRVTQTEIQQFGPQLGSLPDRVQNAILGLAKGQKYDPEVRAQIVNMVKQDAMNEDANQKAREEQYNGLAKNYGFNPKNVVYDVRPPGLRSVLNPLQTLPAPLTGKQKSVAEKLGL